MDELDKAIQDCEISAANAGWGDEGSAWLQFAEWFKELRKLRESAKCPVRL